MKAVHTCLSVTLAALLAAAFVACAMPILGGARGPANCPNGVDYGDAGTCCPPGFAVTQYGKCESDEAPAPTAWGAHRAPDGGK